METTQVEDFTKLERVVPLCIAYEWQGFMKSFNATSIAGFLNFLFAVRDAEIVVGHNILSFDLLERRGSARRSQRATDEERLQRGLKHWLQESEEVKIEGILSLMPMFTFCQLSYGI